MMVVVCRSAEVLPHQKLLKTLTIYLFNTTTIDKGNPSQYDQPCPSFPESSKQMIPSVHSTKRIDNNDGKKGARKKQKSKPHLNENENKTRASRPSQRTTRPES